MTPMTRPESAAIGTLIGVLTGLFTWLWLVAIHPPWALRRCAEALERAVGQ